MFLWPVTVLMIVDPSLVELVGAGPAADPGELVAYEAHVRRLTDTPDVSPREGPVRDRVDH
jgi:hypothetical protein